MRVEILDITDRSGSMNDIRNDVIGGYNTMLHEQKKVPGECRVTQIQFDDHYELNFQAIDIQAVPDLTLQTYVPRGCTALLDAIGRTLNVQGERIAKEKWAEKVIVCIRTDGFENASKEYKLAEIKQMILHAQAHGWAFLFSAADQDAFAAGATMGISGATTSGYNKSDPQGTMRSYANQSCQLTNLRTDAGMQNVAQNDGLGMQNQSNSNQYSPQKWPDSLKVKL